MEETNGIVFSCIIPCSAKDYESQNLKDLIASIKAQDFPQDQIEILVMGPEYGDSEQAKAAGIKQAEGEICAMFCADNIIMNKFLFFNIARRLQDGVGAYSEYFFYMKNDNSLNRYFSLIGNNDPISFYLKKADRKPYYKWDRHIPLKQYFFYEKIPSLGDNGFFYRREYLLQADLDHYYPMDCAEDLRKKGLNNYWCYSSGDIWHRTSESLIPFLIKRYQYARDLYSDRNDRRWKMLDTREDYFRLAFFIYSTILALPALWISIRGFRRIKDWAWFWHWPVCVGFLFTYGLLAFRNLFKYGNFFKRELNG